MTLHGIRFCFHNFRLQIMNQHMLKLTILNHAQYSTIMTSPPLMRAIFQNLRVSLM